MHRTPAVRLTDVVSDLTNVLQSKMIRITNVVNMFCHLKMRINNDSQITNS